MSRTQRSNKLLSPKAGALSSPSQKIRVPPTCRGTGESGLGIRTELLAHDSIPTQSITNIQTLLIHLEVKGKSPRTIRA